MDPNACLRRIADADTRSEVTDACRDLAGWIARGGFEPDWSAYPAGTRRYRAYCRARKAS